MTAPLGANPLLSIVVPSLARDRSLLHTLDCLERQPYPAWECLIILQEAPSPEMLSALKSAISRPLRVFYLKEKNASSARNLGLLEARSEIVLFLDDDVDIENPNFLSAHVYHYSDPSVCAVFGQVRASDRKVRTERHPWSEHPDYGWLYFPSNYAGMCRLRNGGSGNLSVRRSAALSVGGMDAQFEKGAHREESDFCLRLTERYGPILFDPEAWLIHLGEPTGGCRHWGKNSGLHPLHHVTGEWYFILKNWRAGRLKLHELPHHIIALARRQVFNATNLRRPLSVFSAVHRSWSGFVYARQKLKQGPFDLQLQSFDPNMYNLL